MPTAIAPISVIAAIGSATIASPADGVAIGAVRRPKIARIESRREMRGNSLMADKHGILCVAGKDSRVHIFGTSCLAQACNLLLPVQPDTDTLLSKSSASNACREYDPILIRRKVDDPQHSKCLPVR